MQAIKDFIGAGLGIILVIVMWGIGCMIACVPLIVGFWLWRAIL